MNNAKSVLLVIVSIMALLLSWRLEKRRAQVHELERKLFNSVPVKTATNTFDTNIVIGSAVEWIGQFPIAHGWHESNWSHASWAPSTNYLIGIRSDGVVVWRNIQ